MRHIHIIYAHYNVEGRGNKARPAWFDYEKCFVNLLQTIEGNPNVTVHLVMDGKADANWIGKYKDYYTLYETVGGGMESVTHNVFNVVKNLQCSDEDLVYILENDYLHVSNWIDKVQTIFNTYQGMDYISLYDHGDKYFLPMYDELLAKIFITNDHHWRNAPSTCGSYITTKQVLDADFDDQTGVTVPIGDHYKWLFLAQNKGRSILTPIPGLSTHCMEGLLSPAIAWQSINNNTQI
jgi:hypothetical protein